MSSAPVPTDGFAGWAVDVMDQLGAVGAGAVVALENLFPPLPSEAVLPLAGLTAGAGEFSLLAAIVWTTAGSVLGAVALYVLGRTLGRERLRRIVDRMPLVKLADVDRAEAWFAKHGDKAVFFGRMVPLVRSVVSVPAGVERMGAVRFVLLTAAGSAIWNTGFVLAGYGLGSQWRVIDPYVGVAEKIVLGVLVVAVAAFTVRRVRGTRAARAAGTVGSAS